MKDSATNTASAPVISLAIWGTPIRMAGFAPIVNVGRALLDSSGFNPSRQLDRYVEFADNLIYRVRHEFGHRFYILQAKHFRPEDSDSAGRFAIAIAIPKGFKLDGASPFEILSKVYTVFTDRYTVEQPDGKRRFKDVMADKQLFVDILAGYRLVPSHRRFVEMTGTKVVKLALGRDGCIRDFMTDTDYPEFADSEEVRVSLNGETTPGFGTLTIPRIVRYEVWVNGVRAMAGDKPVALISPKDRFAAGDDGDGMSFTLQDIFDGNGRYTDSHGNMAVLNPDEECIHVCLKQGVAATPVPPSPLVPKFVGSAASNRGNKENKDENKVNNPAASNKVNPAAPTQSESSEGKGYSKLITIIAVAVILLGAVIFSIVNKDSNDAPHVIDEYAVIVADEDQSSSDLLDQAQQAAQASIIDTVIADSEIEVEAVGDARSKQDSIEDAHIMAFMVASEQEAELSNNRAAVLAAIKANKGVHIETMPEYKALGMKDRKIAFTFFHFNYFEVRHDPDNVIRARRSISKELPSVQTWEDLISLHRHIVHELGPEIR